MKSFVITFVALNAACLLISIIRFGDGKPWPRQLTPKPAAAEATEIVVHLGIIAWGVYLLSRAAY